MNDWEITCDGPSLLPGSLMKSNDLLRLPEILPDYAGSIIGRDPGRLDVAFLTLTFRLLQGA